MKKAETLHSLIEKKSFIKKIFMYRVCGTGMGAAACLLKESGYEVEGGDITYTPPMSEYLQTTGIICHDLNKLEKNYLSGFDLIVVGNVVPKGSRDADLIENSNVSYTSFPAALGALVLKDFNVVGVSGTHGKTTTTYFLSQMFTHFN
jgi:UDP-N-acetylmuramate-alanine ligase